MRRRTATALAVTVAVLLPACGGGGGGTSKAAWEKKNGALVAAYSRDLSDAVNTLNQGQKTATIGSCTQVGDDGKELRGKALPVPNKTVDGPLRTAIDTGLTAADRCLKGSAETGSQGANDVETAQKGFADARKAMDEAEAAINVWQ